MWLALHLGALLDVRRQLNQELELREKTAHGVQLLDLSPALRQTVVDLQPTVSNQLLLPPVSIQWHAAAVATSQHSAAVATSAHSADVATSGHSADVATSGHSVARCCCCGLGAVRNEREAAATAGSRVGSGTVRSEAGRVRHCRKRSGWVRHCRERSLPFLRCREWFPSCCPGPAPDRN